MSGRKILVAFLLNLFFSVFEVVGGVLTNSVAIISDAIHDFGDAISIGISYFLERKSKKKPDDKYTYGYLRYSVLGALITTTILLLGSTLVIISATKRLFNPVAVNYDGMIIFAVVGVIVNFLAAYYTRDGENVNQKSVNLHMLEDVLNWVVVLIGSIVIKFTNFNMLDSIMSIGVAIFIFYQALKNLFKILDLFLEKTPKDISLEEIKKEILKIKGIEDVHHIHLWSIDGINNYATMHVISSGDSHKIKDEIRSYLKLKKINHVTIEIEKKNEKCSDKECNPKKEEANHHHHH